MNWLKLLFKKLYSPSVTEKDIKEYADAIEALTRIKYNEEFRLAFLIDPNWALANVWDQSFGVTR